jgi:hypothetical protein
MGPLPLLPNKGRLDCVLHGREKATHMHSGTQDPVKKLEKRKFFFLLFFGCLR